MKKIILCVFIGFITGTFTDNNDIDCCAKLKKVEDELNKEKEKVYDIKRRNFPWSCTRGNSSRSNSVDTLGGVNNKN